MLQISSLFAFFGLYAELSDPKYKGGRVFWFHFKGDFQCFMTNYKFWGGPHKNQKIIAPLPLPKNLKMYKLPSKRFNINNKENIKWCVYFWIREEHLLLQPSSLLIQSQKYLWKKEVTNCFTRVTFVVKCTNCIVKGV